MEYSHNISVKDSADQEDNAEQWAIKQTAQKRIPM